MKKKSRTATAMLLFVFLMSSGLHAQNKLRGTIYDAQSHEALIGASIYFPDLHEGTVSNLSGEFEIDIASGKFSMFISYIGYQNKLLKLQTDTVKSRLNIFLKQEAFQSQEIIISGNRFSLQHENAIEVNCLTISVSDQNKANLMEQIAEVPGVDMISKGQGVSKPVIRGLSNTNVLFIDNGIRMENFQFSENHPFMVDEFGIERMEIIKGPASLLYGSDAVGGVLFAVREKPPHGKKLSGDFSFRYFDNNKGLHSSLGVQTSHNNFHAGIRASIKSQQDYIDGRGVQVPNTRFNQKSVKSVLGYSHKKGNFDVYYDYSEMQLGMCIEPSIALVDENSRENEVWYQKLSNHVLSVKNKLFFNDLKLDIKLAFQSNNRQFLASDLTPQFKMVDMLLQTWSSEIKSTYSFKNAEVIAGVQAMYQTNRNADAPDHVIPDAEMMDMSFFALFSSSFHEKTHFQSGLRYDYRRIATEAETDKPETDNSYQNISFSVGLTHQLSEKLLLRANLASAHRSPNMAELTQNGMHGAYYEKGNSKMKSQRNYEPDVSIHYHSDKLIYEISAFYNRLSNYIFLGKTDETTASGVPIYQYAQTDANIWGFETGIRIMPVSFLQLHANYAFLSAKQENGDFLPFIPQNKLRSGVKLNGKKLFFAEKPFFTFSTTYAFAHRQAATFESETPAYFTADISLGFEKKLKKQSLYFSVGINNLLDVAYIDHLSTLKSLDYQQIGRNFHLNFKIKF